jgi:hypothetical protein
MKKSKHQEIKEHLQQGHTITGLTAMALFNVYRLSSVIHRLRNDGMKIKTTMVTTPSGDTFARYELAKDDEVKV